MGKTTILAALVVLVAALGIALNVRIFQNHRDRIDLQQLRDTEQDKRIEEMEKEIRLLKTDLQVLKYGFKEEDEE